MKRSLLLVFSLILTSHLGCKPRTSRSALQSNDSGIVEDAESFRPKTMWQGIFRMTWQPLDHGVQVVTVERLGYAHVIGLSPGDVILKLNGEEVSSARPIDQIATWISANKPAQWFFHVARKQGEEGDAAATILTAPPGYACNPMPPILIGCGPAR